ncbi:hypothetical protein ACRRTK_010736 [Alexandromys fortis]
MSIFHIFQSGVHFVNPQEIDAERIDFGTFMGMILANFKLGFSGQNEDNVDLGELMFSLCYLPTAGRLTITVIKARNLKAMDITGASDPYVKVSLMCDGRRLKKRKTSTKRNTLNPVYNEAIVFDVPPESIDQIHLSIAVMDYDRVGHNEVIGVCQVGNEAERLGREHWSEMLSYPRKPIAHWHSLMEDHSEHVEEMNRRLQTDSSSIGRGVLKPKKGRRRLPLMAMS